MSNPVVISRSVVNMPEPEAGVTGRPALEDHGRNLRVFGRVCNANGVTGPQEQNVRHNVAQVNAEDATRLPHPTVLVVDRDMVVRFVDVQPDYTVRTEVADIVAALAGLV